MAGVLVSGLLKVKEEEVIGRSVGDVGDEEGSSLMIGEAGTDVVGIDLAGEPGAVDGVGDLGAGCAAAVVVTPGNSALVGRGEGDVTAGGAVGRMVGRG